MKEPVNGENRPIDRTVCAYQLHKCGFKHFLTFESPSDPIGQFHLSILSCTPRATTINKCFHSYWTTPNLHEDLYCKIIGSVWSVDGTQNHLNLHFAYRRVAEK